MREENALRSRSPSNHSIRHSEILIFSEGLPAIEWVTIDRFSIKAGRILTSEVSCMPRQFYIGKVFSPSLHSLQRLRIFKGSLAVALAALHSLSHSGLFQAARACRKTFNLKGRNFRFEYTAKNGDLLGSPLR
jgi:hypothetical protein